MDTFQLALDFLDDVNQQLEEVSVDAINNTADRVVQRVVNHASTELTLPSIFLRQHIRVIRRASEGTKEALVRADQARTNLGRFRHSRVDSNGVSGISVQRRQGRTAFIEGAFLIFLRGVPFIALDKDRVREQFPRVRVNSGPSRIQVLYGPSHNQVFFSRGFEFGQNEMQIEIDRYINDTDLT